MPLTCSGLTLHHSGHNGIVVGGMKCFAVVVCSILCRHLGLLPIFLVGVMIQVTRVISELRQSSRSHSELQKAKSYTLLPVYAIIVLSHVAACMRSLTCTTIIDSVASSPPDVSPVRTREVTRIGLGSAPFIHGGPAFAAGAAPTPDLNQSGRTPRDRVRHPTRPPVAQRPPFSLPSLWPRRASGGGWRGGGC